MPYVIQSLPQPSIIEATIHHTISPDELKFVLRDIYTRLRQRDANTLTHIVLDATSQTFPSEISIKGYVLVLSKLHEIFYRKRTITMWLATDISYYDKAHYYAQRQCLPVYIHDNLAAVYNRIERIQGATAPFNAEAQVAPFTIGTDEVSTQPLDD